MTNTPATKKRQWVLWVALLLLLAYPWSIGPVEWYYRRSLISTEMYRDIWLIVYWPIEWLSNSSETARESIRWYLGRFWP